MTTSRAPLTDHRLSEALRDLVGTPDSSQLIIDVARLVEATPQPRPSFWRRPALAGGIPALAAVMLLTVLVAGVALVVGRLTAPPDPAPSDEVRNGPIVMYAFEGPIPTPGPGTFPNPPGSIVAIDPATGSTSDLGSLGLALDIRDLPDGEWSQLSWSADGSRVAFLKEGSVFVADSLSARRVGSYGIGNPAQVSLSPDGARVALSSNFQLVVLDVSTGKEHVIGHVIESAGVEHVAWSPDGSRIAVSVFVAPMAHRLLVVNADGSDASEIARGSEGYATVGWSPDGSQIAFLFEDRDSGRSDVNIVDLGGGDVRTLLHDVDASGIAWSPDGRQLAVAYVDEQQTGVAVTLHDLWVVDLDDAERHLVRREVIGVPAWRPVPAEP